jgi:hypothetical protein
MGKFIFGAIVGFILSDVVTSKFPQAQQFKIPPTLIFKSTGLKGFGYYYRYRYIPRYAPQFRMYRGRWVDIPIAL